MSSEKEYKKLLLASAILGLIGSLVLFVGLLIDYIANGILMYDLAISAWIFATVIICLITVIGVASSRGFIFTDERLMFFAILLFIFAPTLLISNYTTPMYYLLEDGITRVGFSQYLSFGGLAALLIAFIPLTWIFLWKNRFSASSVVSDQEIRIVKLSRFLMSTLGIISGIGLILGMVFPTEAGVSFTLLVPSVDGIDYSALSFIILLVGVIATSIMTFLSNFEKLRMPKVGTPLIGFVAALIVLPGYAPVDAYTTTWSTGILKLLAYTQHKFGSYTVWTYVLIGSIIALMVTLLIAIGTYFIRRSGLIEPKDAGVIRDTRRTRRRDAQPPASTGLEGLKAQVSLAEQLTNRMESSATQDAGVAHQASTLTGPPSATTQPAAAQATIPSVPSAGTQAAEKPTCPFCGKELSYIEEYQRYYCYSCSQYV